MVERFAAARCVVAGAIVVCVAGAWTARATPRTDQQPERDPAGVTFSADIAPLIGAHCTACHRPQGSAPFSLLTYQDVKARASDIAAATKNRAMPPWKPEPGHGEFIGDRRLSDAQIALIQRWVAGGRLEGEPTAALPPPTDTPWQLGEPDLVLRMSVPYSLPAGGDDRYRHFVMPIPVAVTRYVKAWELRPDNLQVLHHSTMEIDGTGASRRLDEQDPQPGYEGLVSHSAMAPDGYFLGWAPGQTPYVSPDGMAFPVRQGSDLVLMLHLRPRAEPERIRVAVGLYFADRPPDRVPALLRLTRQDLDIPPSQTQVVTSSFKLPVDVDVFTVQPHAHNLARSIESFATVPNGSIRRLISIKDWDVNWQDVYRYAQPVLLPAGTTVTARWTYDNSTRNRRNPNIPPRRVMFGPRTSDEMAELWFQVLPHSEADRSVLVANMGSAVRLESIKGYQMMLHAEPENAALHDDLALLHAAAGNFNEMAAHFTQSLRLRPGSAAAHYNLGTALLALKKTHEARVEFERAITSDSSYANAYHALGGLFFSDGRLPDAERYFRNARRLAPNDATVHHDLGVVFQAQGKVAEALAQYRDALALDPGNAQTHFGVGLLLRVQGKVPEAVSHLRTALELTPDWPQALSELAWTLATSGDPAVRAPEEALRLARRGAALMRPPTASALDVLAAALAATSQFDEAIATARNAISVARRAQQDDLASQIQGRLNSYLQKK